VVLGDAGTGLIGWRHLAPFCSRCAVGRPSLTLPEFAAKLDGPVDIDQPTAGAGLSPLLVPRVPLAMDGDPVPGLVDPPEGSSSPAHKPDEDESPIAILTAEIALLHARLDDIQSRMDR
jgi:hypothetical protein